MSVFTVRKFLNLNQVIVAFFVLMLMFLALRYKFKEESTEIIDT